MHAHTKIGQVSTCAYFCYGPFIPAGINVASMMLIQLMSHRLRTHQLTTDSHTTYSHEIDVRNPFDANFVPTLRPRIQSLSDATKKDT